MIASDSLARCGFGFWQGEGDLRNPSPALTLHAQQAGRTVQRHRSAVNGHLAHDAVLAEGQQEPIARDAPVLIVPLAKRLAQQWEDAKCAGALPDGAGISEGLILDRAG